jgi:hypothetical protein
MTSVKQTARKVAANQRNAQRSTGPRTAAGKSAASLNALKHGLNTPVPDYMVRACQSHYRTLLDHAQAGAASRDDTDLVYVLATRARLREHRAELMRTIVDWTASDDRAPDSALDMALKQLGRLESYERKSLSRLAGLLKDRERRVGETNPRAPSARLRSLTS